jgi:hypothetical protein
MGRHLYPPFPAVVIPSADRLSPARRTRRPRTLMARTVRTIEGDLCSTPRAIRTVSGGARSRTVPLVRERSPGAIATDTKKMGPVDSSAEGEGITTSKCAELTVFIREVARGMWESSTTSPRSSAQTTRRACASPTTPRQRGASGTRCVATPSCRSTSSRAWSGSSSSATRTTPQTSSPSGCPQPSSRPASPTSRTRRPSPRSRARQRSRRSRSP